jgi:aspartyl-tRNA synthetase
MAFADGERVMEEVENLIRSVYAKFLQPQGSTEKPLLDSPFFLRMTYEEAMSKHGSDKPDLRIKGLVSSLSVSKNCN